MSTSNTLAELVTTALPKAHTWSGRPGPDQLASLPGGPAVLLFLDEHDTPVQLLTTQQLKRFAMSRLSKPVETRRGRADLAEVVRGVRWRPAHCPFEARWWYYRLARVLHPREYRKLVSFGRAWFLHVDWEQHIPELRVSERVWYASGLFIGPWPTHKACQEALDGLQDLFDLCRHPEQVRKSPHGLRCAYAEMGRCDAPCDGTAPLEAYRARCRAAWLFAAGAVDAWIAGAAERMKRAAKEQKYELAGQVKQQLGFAHTWQTQWAPRVRPAEQLNYLFVLPVTRRRAWKLHLFRRGYLADGPVVPDRRVGSATAAWLKTELSQSPEEVPDAIRMEQTWLVCHLLLHRESDSALVVPLPALTIPADLEEALQAEAATRRGQRYQSAAKVM
ncbi:MAG: hypothetical protein KAY37_14260 [Phycisphaerae bacterium]|nr:hypothetical protein [Phycisphaerae bacterium]